MGAVSPVPFFDEAFRKKVEERIIIPTIEGLKQDNIPYKGFIFIGLMNVEGDPFVIEYNVRMGDPESQAVLPRIENDFVELLAAAANGTLDKIQLETSEDTTVTIVLASEGYPGAYDKGQTITGLDQVSDDLVFHAGTIKQDQLIKTNGGRVLAVTGRASSVLEAIDKGYNSIRKIQWDGMQFRKDIGQDILLL
jgi:phosphoribosylamine--glycine ligase